MYLAEVKRDLGKSKKHLSFIAGCWFSDPRYAKEAGALWTASLADAIHKSSISANGSKTVNNRTFWFGKRICRRSWSASDALGDTNEGREASIKASQVEADTKVPKSAIKRFALNRTCAEVATALRCKTLDSNLCGSISRSSRICRWFKKCGSRASVKFSTYGFW